MTHSSFSIREAIEFGWEKTKAHSGLLFKTLLILFALNVASAIVSEVLSNQLIGVLAGIAIGVAEFVIGVGLTVVSLRLAQGKHTDLDDLIPPMDLLWRYFAASFLVGLIAVGVMLFIILIVLAIAAVAGGMQTTLFAAWAAVGMAIGAAVITYIGVRFSMVRYAVIEGNDPMESLERSTELTKGRRWHILGFLVVIGLLNIGGALLLLVGLLVTIPVSIIAYAHVYEKLRKHSHS